MLESEKNNCTLTDCVRVDWGSKVSYTYAERTVRECLFLPRALYGVYSMTKMLAQFVLLKAENAILEVQDDDDNEEEEVEDGIDTNRAKEEASGPLDRGPGPIDGVAAGPGAGTAQAENKANRRLVPLNTNGMRTRNTKDEFGDELPDTPGGWKGEWDL